MNSKKMKLSTLLPMLLTMLLACSADMSTISQPKPETLSPEPPSDQPVIKTGTVTFVSLEGGFFGLVADDGKNYDPINLAEPFQINGLRVQFKARILHDVWSFHMWGRIVEIIEIEILE